MLCVVVRRLVAARVVGEDEALRSLVKHFKGRVGAPMPG